MTNKQLKFYQDFDKTEGSLVMENAKTAELYRTLKGYGDSKKAKKTETEKVTSNPAYFFAAFNKEQFKEGYDKMKPHLAEGEKIISVGAGCFFSKTGLELFNKANSGIKQRIKNECDPQEVYCIEYNNHECMFDYDGDAPAMAIIIEYFGKRAAKSIQRFNAYHSIEYIISEYK